MMFFHNMIYVYIWRGILGIVYKLQRKKSYKAKPLLLEAYRRSKNYETKEIQFFWLMHYALTLQAHDCIHIF